ncbi:MAG: hypothetical protein GC137_00485 [Alphaproteobacteria bacterium]|nr:hypothetical protein [Alphaproteobacteria bacterium]
MRELKSWQDKLEYLKRNFGNVSFCVEPVNLRGIPIRGILIYSAQLDDPDVKSEHELVPLSASAGSVEYAVVNLFNKVVSRGIQGQLKIGEQPVHVDWGTLELQRAQALPS